MKNIRDLDIRGKKLLIRVDFNVPLDAAGEITDDIRIRAALPTIEYGLAENAKVVLCSHLGRPKGERRPQYSLAPVARRLAALISKEVKLAPDCIGVETKTMVDQMRNGEVVLLENLRFHGAEQENDPEFAAQLATLADIYINDAFAVSHRRHASVVGIISHLDQYAAGFLLQKEMDYFHQAISDPKRPLVAIIGGAKVSGKLGALRNLMNRVDTMIIGGAMANTFLKSLGYEIGKSLVENDLLETAGELLAKARQQDVKLYLPVDVVIAPELEDPALPRTVSISQIPPEMMILDIGTGTVKKFSEALTDAATIVWNGPMGAFEWDNFAAGTMAMVRLVANSNALTIVGGGDTDMAVHRAGAADKISYISTGGGAFLQLMEGKTLPGVEVLNS